jgi:hypothetical protein
MSFISWAAVVALCVIWLAFSYALVAYTGLAGWIDAIVLAGFWFGYAFIVHCINQIDPLKL